MNKLKITIIAFVISIFATTAQNNAEAEKITNNLLSKLNTQSLEANFKLDVYEKKNVVSQSLQGNLILQGKKFHLNTPQVKAWFDGKTQWAYVAQNNEVSISTPTPEELAETNPAIVISNLKSKSNISFSKVKSKGFHIILLSPKQKSSEIVRVTIQVNKSNGNLSSVFTENKNGSSSLLTFTTYQLGAKMEDSKFVFDKNKYKSAYINDLR